MGQIDVAVSVFRLQISPSQDRHASKAQWPTYRELVEMAWKLIQNNLLSQHVHVNIMLNSL